MIRIHSNDSVNFKQDHLVVTPASIHANIDTEAKWSSKKLITQNRIELFDHW